MSANYSKIINWTDLGREKFERIVEALIAKNFEDGEINTPNGRGGDGGIDASVKLNDEFMIFQFKYFPDGFPSHNRSRRNQISRSFKSAIKWNPTKWILVIPENPTPSEFSFAKKLQSPDSPNLKISVWGRRELDLIAAKYPEIVAFFEKPDSLERALSNIGEERHAPRTTSDIQGRLKKIAEDAATMDEDWTLDFSRTDSLSTFILRPKHPLAHKNSPIKVSLELDFSAEEGPLKRQWQRHYDYGIGSSITLPAKVVTNFSVEGPSFLEMSGNLSRVVMSELEADRDPMPCVVETYDEGDLTGRFHGKAARFGSGARGASVELNFYGTVKILIPLPSDRRTSEGDISLNSGEFSSDSKNTYNSSRLMRSLHESTMLKIFIDGAPLVELKSQSNALDAEVKHYSIIEQYSDDINIIESRLNVDIGIDDEISDYNRAMARSVRLILDGYMTRHPSRSQFGVKLNRNALSSSNIDDMLSGEESALKVECENHEFSIGDSRIQLEAVSFYSPSAKLQSSDGAVSSENSDDSSSALLKTVDGKPMFWFIEPNVRQDSGGKIVSSLWNIIGVEDF